MTCKQLVPRKGQPCKVDLLLSQSAMPIAAVDSHSAATWDPPEVDIGPKEHWQT